MNFRVLIVTAGALESAIVGKADSTEKTDEKIGKKKGRAQERNEINK